MKQRISIFAVSILVCAATATTLRAQEYRPEFVRTTLDNGLNVLFHVDRTTASVTVDVAYHAGSFLDPEGKSGLANLCGGLAALGSKNVSYQDMMRMKYFTSAQIYGNTSVDLMSINSTFPAEYLEAALWVEADRMKNGSSPINEKIVKAAVNNIVREQRGKVRDPLSGVDEKIYENLYPKGHPYRHVVPGDTTELKKLTAKDIRGFIQTYYVPANASITVSGNFDVQKARDYITKYFEDIPAGKNYKRTSAPMLSSLGQANIIKEEYVSVSRMYIVIPTVPRNHPDAAVLDFVAKMFAGTANAWLQVRMVNNNPYVNSVEATQASRVLDGNFWIVVNCTFESKLKDIFAQCVREIKTLANAPLQVPDLMEAQNFTKKQYRLMMENQFGINGRANVLNTCALIDNNPLFISDMIREQMRITPARIKEVLAKYFTMNNVFVLSVVPKGNKDRGVVFE